MDGYALGIWIANNFILKFFFSLFILKIIIFYFELVSVTRLK